MAKKLEVIEIQEVPVVDPMAERVKIKAEIDGVVAGKIAAVIKVFQDGREKDIDELMRLRQVLEDLKKKQGPLLTDRATLVSGIMGVGTKGVGDLDLKLRLLEKEIKSCEGQVEKVFSKLTELPPLSFPLLNFLMRR
jgi:hydrogenase maturation factor HypE